MTLQSRLELGSTLEQLAQRVAAMKCPALPISIRYLTAERVLNSGIARSTSRLCELNFLRQRPASIDNAHITFELK
jgi:hypothetical protein